MANQEQLDILKQGVDAWNTWRNEHPEIEPDLSKADFRDIDLSKINFTKADLSRANLSRAILREANFREANLSIADLNNADLNEANLSATRLSIANLSEANFSGVNFSKADLSNASLSRANLSRANFNEANLSRANLSKAILVETNFSWSNLSKADLSGANLTGCFVYAVSAWDVNLSGAKQANLIITSPYMLNESMITVDNLEVAQFIYLLLNNKKIRDVIDTITSKVVLILGRFTPERKAILDAIKEELRKQNYSPVLFDFEKPASRDITETISTLAHMARFVIADITDAKSIPQELKTIVPNLPSVPVQPLIINSQHEYGMFEHFRRFPWVLPLHRYTDKESLLRSLKENVIDPAEQKAKELEKW